MVSFDKYDVDDWYDSIEACCTKKTFYINGGKDYAQRYLGQYDNYHTN